MPRTIVEKLEIFFFVLCNRLSGGRDDWDRAVVKVTKELKVLLKSSWLQKIVASHHEYRKVIVEAMFASAVRVGDLDLVSWLITEGIDPELPIQMTGFRSVVCVGWISNYDTCHMTPIEVAFCKSDIDLTSLLIAKDVMASRRLSSMSSAELVVTEVGNSRSAQLRLLELVLHEDTTLSVAQCLRALSLAACDGSFDCARLLLEEIRLRDCKSACTTELLRIAVIIGHDNIVDALLEEGANVNGNCCNIDLLEGGFSKTERFPHFARSPIAAALLGGRSSIFRVLLNRGASPNGHLLKEPTPLQCAAYMDDTEAIGILDEFHANINQITERPMTGMGFFDVSLERTALQVAIDADNTRATYALLERGAKLLGGELSMAIKNNFSAIYDTLLDLGASVNDTLPESNGSALEHAILNRNEPMVHRLLSSDRYTYCAGALCASVSIREIGNLSQHAMVNAIMRNRKSPTYENLLLEGTALAIATNRGDTSLVSLLLSKGIRSTHCFHSDAWHGGEEDLSRERHSNWWRHPSGSMSVLASTVRANPGIVALLLQSGYYVDEVTFCTAAQYSRRPVFEMVLGKAMETNHGLFPQAKRAPLQCAISSGNMETIELLLQHGAELDMAAPGFDQFAFQHVAEPMRLQLIKLLLGAGIDVRAQRSSFFQNALVSAIYQHDMESVGLFLEAGADVNASLGPGHQSMLQMAVGAGALEVVEMILDRGGKVDYGSLEISVRKGCFGLVEALLVACDHGHEFEDSEHPQAWAELASLSHGIGHLDLQQLFLHVSISVASFSQSRFPGDSRALYQTGRSTTTEPLQSNKPGQGPSIPHSEWNSNLSEERPFPQARDGCRDITQVVEQESQSGTTEATTFANYMVNMGESCQVLDSEPHDYTDDLFDMFIQIPD